MKRTFLFTLAVASSLAVCAQDTEPKLRTDMEVKPRIGLKAGANISFLEVDDDVNTNFETNSKTSLHGGVFFNLPVTPKFRIQPEVLYSIQGTKANDLNSPSELSGLNEYDFHYFSVPVMAQLWTGNHGLYVELGPQFSYLSSANGDRSDDHTAIDMKERNYVKKTDVAGAAGVGYLTRAGLGLNARYVHGFSNVWNADDAPASTRNWEYSNRTVQLSLTYHFGAGK
jgi:hypothetical protein